MTTPLFEQVHADPDVFQLKVPFPNVVTTETNVYVVRDGDDVLVVDAGAPTEGAGLYFGAALEQLGVDPARARYFLTHLHYDHAGLVGGFVPDEAVVYLGRGELPAARADFGERSARYSSARFVEEGLTAEEAARAHAPLHVSMPIDVDARPVVVVDEGDEVAVGRYRFRVVNVPGHTRGHVALLHPESGICFTGDHVLFIISPGLSLFVDGGDALSAYLDSLDKVAALGCSRLFISHGENRLDFAERIEALKAHHAKRCDAMAAVVEQAAARGEEPTGADVIRAIGWRIPFATIDECEPLQQWSIYTLGIVLLDHLVAEGRLARRADEADVHRYRPAGAGTARENG
ncbi:MAG: MBL fold metallo-hydrolase [Eggerthellaceae bacterium]|nr:MBL fold metallo-hydrolase [Eggerthellaceae bacterium]